MVASLLIHPAFIVVHGKDQHDVSNQMMRSMMEKNLMWSNQMWSYLVVQHEATQPPVQQRKYIGAKPLKECKRQLANELFCTAGFSYLINYHCVAKKTGALTL